MIDANRLRIRLSQPLPGLKAQLTMAPPYRASLMAESPKRDYREAAVLVLVVDNQLILTQRKAHLKDHAGQISFAGGKRENNEPFVATAIREAKEELGIDVPHDAILGALTPLYIPPSHFMVHPYVAFLDHAPTFKPQDQEVEQVLQIPLAQLPQITTQIPWQRGNSMVDMPVYLWGEHCIWGATAMIISELWAVLKGYESQ